jgi:hypothetical protein
MRTTIPGLRRSPHGYWESEINLPAWAGFTYPPPYSGSPTAPGECLLRIGGDEAPRDAKWRAEYDQSYQYLTARQQEIRDQILDALLARYGQMRHEADYPEQELAQYMPAVTQATGFQPLIRLTQVHLLNVFRNGLAYVGYEFACRWDEEHGLGVMTFQDQVIRIGGAETAFLTWLAESHLTGGGETKSLSTLEKVEMMRAQLARQNQQPRRWWEYWRK